MGKNYHPIPWRDSISRPITTVSMVAGGDDTTRQRRQGGKKVLCIHSREFYFQSILLAYLHKRRFSCQKMYTMQPNYGQSLTASDAVVENLPTRKRVSCQEVLSLASMYI
jgi:hypothetical protein